MDLGGKAADGAGREPQARKRREPAGRDEARNSQAKLEGHHHPGELEQNDDDCDSILNIEALEPREDRALERPKVREAVGGCRAYQGDRGLGAERRCHVEEGEQDVAAEANQRDPRDREPGIDRHAECERPAQALSVPSGSKLRHELRKRPDQAEVECQVEPQKSAHE